MKQLFVLFYLLFLPVVTFADNGLHDSCVENGKYKSEYTIDKRCYVTDEQKQISPYNAVVSFLDQDNYRMSCTGTVVKRDGEYFLYTAKHCTDSDYDNQSDKVLRIKLQDGRTFDTLLVSQGDYVLGYSQNDFGDWTKYKIPVKKDDNTLPFVQTNSFENGKAQVVGYGRLKIMSDKDIRDLKNNYIDFLKNYVEGMENNNGGGTKINTQNGFTKDGGVKGYQFDRFTRHYMFSEYMDWGLKVSYCEISKGVVNGCQGWGGNSGGPIFDDNGNIMGIAVRGIYQVGGAEHGKMSLFLSVDSDKKAMVNTQGWIADKQSTQEWLNANTQKTENEQKNKQVDTVTQKRLDDFQHQDSKRYLNDTLRFNNQSKSVKFF